MKRIEEITPINAGIVYGHKINSLVLIYLVYYVRLMLERIHCCWIACTVHVEHKGNHEKLSDHKKIATS